MTAIAWSKQETVDAMIKKRAQINKSPTCQKARLALYCDGELFVRLWHAGDHIRVVLHLLFVTVMLDPHVMNRLQHLF